MATSATQRQQPTRPANAAIPTSVGQIHNLKDSVELVPGLTRVNLFPAVANADPLLANYTKQPFAAEGQQLRINRIGFNLNAGVVRITGADAAATTLAVQTFINNFAAATVEYGQGAGKCASGEIPLSELLAFDIDTEYVAAGVANLHIIRRALPVLSEPLIVAAGNHFNLQINFEATAGYPASGTVAGLKGGDLMLQANVAGVSYAPAQSAEASRQVHAVVGTATLAPLDM